MGGEPIEMVREVDAFNAGCNYERDRSLLLEHKLFLIEEKLAEQARRFKGLKDAARLGLAKTQQALLDEKPCEQIWMTFAKETGEKTIDIILETGNPLWAKLFLHYVEASDDQKNQLAHLAGR